MTFKIGFYRLRSRHIYSMRIYIVVTDVVNGVTYSRKTESGPIKLIMMGESIRQILAKIISIVLFPIQSAQYNS